MRLPLRFALLAGLTVLCLAASDARAADKGADLRIAVVRLHEIYQNYEYTKQMEASIEKDLEPDKNEIEKTRNELLKLKEALRTARDTEPGDYAWFVKMQEIKAKEYYIKVRRQEVSKRLNERMSTLYKTFWAHFQKAVEVYAIQNDYDLVLRANEPGIRNEEFLNIQREIALKSVLYHGKSFDRTDQIVELMNRIYRENASEN